MSTYYGFAFGKMWHLFVRKTAEEHLKQTICLQGFEWQTGSLLSQCYFSYVNVIINTALSKDDLVNNEVRMS